MSEIAEIDRAPAVEKVDFTESRRENVLHFLRLPLTAPRYIDPSGLNERLHGLLACPDPEIVFALERRLKRKAGLTDAQLSTPVEETTPDTIPERQLRKVADVIARTKIPLRDSWSEPQLLHELFLATGIQFGNLDDITGYQFNGPELTKVNREYRLLNLDTEVPRIGHCYFTVQVSDEQPGTGLVPAGVTTGYRLNFKEGNREQALRDFTHSVEFNAGDIGGAENPTAKIFPVHPISLEPPAVEKSRGMGRGWIRTRRT